MSFVIAERAFIILGLLLCTAAAALFPQTGEDGDERPRVAIFALENKMELQGYETLEEEIPNTIALTLRMMKDYSKS